MTNATWSMVFETYLLLGTAWLVVNLVDRRIRQKMTRLSQVLRPGWTEVSTKFLVIFLLCIFAPLAVYNTLLIFGILQ